MSNNIKVKVDLGEHYVDKEKFLIELDKREDGWYIDIGDGFEKYGVKEKVGERTIKQLIRKEFCDNYGGDPSELKIEN